MQFKEILIENSDSKLLYTWFSAMFTRVDMVLVADIQSDKLQNIAEQLKAIIEKTEQVANRFDVTSEVALVNKTAYGKAVTISDELYALIDSCKKYHEQTLGLFDITANSKNGFNQGISNIHLYIKLKTIQFLHADVQLDFSGFIKGYVLIEIQDFLQKSGIENALINMGNSSILAMGNHPFGYGWKVKLADESSHNEIVLYNQCLTTSGNMKNTKWPVVNPKTMEKMQGSKNISVVTNNPALGEVLSTALFIANEWESEQIIKNIKEEITVLNN